MGVQVLVTGGAGYLGAHIVRILLEQDFQPIIVDDLSSGSASYVPEGQSFCVQDFGDVHALADILERHAIQAIIHLAAVPRTEAGDRNPLSYYQQHMQKT